jgi:hypothetical protein
MLRTGTDLLALSPERRKEIILEKAAELTGLADSVHANDVAYASQLREEAADAIRLATELRAECSK